ncbi:hypothetical protein FSOLCH5_009887 [Fusarium solani]
MASPGDGDSQASPAPSAGNDLGKRKRNSFWGAYQQDQYISNSFGFISRIREAKTSVKYPAEVFDDVNITETGILQRPDRVSFLRGWNFCTDLYRLLQSQFIVTTSYL